MKTKDKIEKMIMEALNEIDIEDVGEICYTGGSTHVLKTCKIGTDKYYLKFSDENLFDTVDPSLQILVEYLSYKIYSLYQGVSVPEVQLVFDKKKQRIGLASSNVEGDTNLRKIDPKKLAKMLTAGIFVDIFLANWDVIGTGGGNVVFDKEKATRIDPGGALTFRAQGGRKGSKFSAQAGELKTMTDPKMGAGEIFQYADLREAAKSFVPVSWQQIYERIVETNNKDIVPDMKRHGMEKLLGEWQKEVTQITDILKQRYAVILNHIKFVVQQNKKGE